MWHQLAFQAFSSQKDLEETIEFFKVRFYRF